MKFYFVIARSDSDEAIPVGDCFAPSGLAMTARGFFNIFNLRLTRVCFLLSAVSFQLSAVAWAQDSSGPQILFKTQAEAVSPIPAGGDVFNQRISLDLRNIDVIEALKFLSLKVGMNIITTKSVSGRVSLSVDNALFKDVFDIMLRSNGLAYAKSGDIYNIMTEPEYKAFYGENFLDMRIVKVFRLKYSIPEQAFNLLDAVKSSIGRVVVDPENGNVLVMDTPDKLKQMESSLDEFEKKNSVVVFNLKYAKAKEVEEVLKTQLDSKKAGYIKADERNNQIVVQTLPERMSQITELVEKLDRQTKQVLIETKIIKVKLTDQFDNGLEWEGIVKTATDHGANYAGTQPFSVIQGTNPTFQSRKQFLDGTMKGDIDAFPFSGNTSNLSSSTKTTIGEKLHFGIVDGKRDFDILYKLLQTLGKSRILANPKLVVVNNQEAKIHIGEKQAYTTSTTTAGSTGTNTISEEVTFVDVGIQLSVTPTINDDGYITMKIRPEVSSVSSTLTTSGGNKIPIVDTSLTETTVMIKDNTTLIIGGLRRESKSSSSEGFPFFSKLPFFGNFFKSGTSTVERNELVVMLTPHIISGMELDTGNEREFGHKPGKAYRDYQSIGDDYRKNLSLPEEERPPSKEVPQEINPKPYRPFEEKEEMQIKEMRYEPS